MSDIRIHRQGDQAVSDGLALLDDIDITTGDLILTSGAEGIAQDVLTRLRFFLGEWFLDVDVGIPWFQQILVKDPDLAAIRAIFVQAILETPGIERLDSLDIDFDRINRTMRVGFTGVSSTDEPVVFDQELVIDI